MLALNSAVFVIWLAFGLALVGPGQAVAQLTNAGAGGGGWLQSGTFHPSDDNYIVIGGDNSGIFRSTDFGVTWNPWIDGLANEDEGLSFYVDDLLGVKRQGQTRFYAATRAGIYSAPENGSWSHETMDEDGYKWKKQGSTFAERAQLMPFSCLAYDGSRFLYAGAGRPRWNSTPQYDQETDNYPGLLSSEFETSETNIPHGFEIPPGTLEWDQWSVWYKDLNASTPTWLPDLDAERPTGSVRDLSTVRAQGTTYIAVATRDGLWLKNGAVWDTLGGPDLGGVEGDTTCWSLHLTPQRILYAAFNNPAGGVSGVYVIRDVGDPATWTWTRVGANDMTDLPPESEDITEIGLGTSLIYLSVAQSGNTHVIYVGARDASGSNSNVGLYKTEVSRGDNPADAVWEHLVWYHAPTDVFSPNFDPGWQIFYHTAIIFEPAVSYGDPDKLLIQANSRLHTSVDGGDNWLNAYTNGTDPGGPWSTTGYTQMAIRDITFDQDGFVVTANADFGVFRATDASAGQHHYVQPPSSGSPNCNEVWTTAANQSQPMIDTRNTSGDEILFVSSGDMIMRGVPGKMIWVDPNETWHDITCDLDSADHYVFEGFEAQNPTVLWVAYEKFNLPVGTEDAVSERHGVLRGVGIWPYPGSPPPASTNPGIWSWTDMNAGLSDANGWYATSDVMLDYVGGNVLLTARRADQHDGGLFRVTAIGGWEKIFPGATGDEADYIDFRSITASADGMIVYAGTAGGGGGIGVVLKADLNDCLTDPNCSLDSASTWDWVPISDGNSFEFEVPFFRDGFHDLAGWSISEAGYNLTGVYALAVDRNDPEVVYAGLLNVSGSMPQEGVWKYDPVAASWSQLPTGSALQGVGVDALGISDEDDETLYIGAAGHELYLLDLPTGALKSAGASNPGLNTRPKFRLEVERISPTPSRSSSTIAFRAPGGRIEVTIFDVAGRRVRDLGTKLEAAGRGQVVWDGRNQSGQSVGPGIYFARVKAGGQEESARLVMLR